MAKHPAAHALQPTKTHQRPTGRAHRAVVRSWREMTTPLAQGDLAAIKPLRHLTHSALTAWGVTTRQSDDVLIVVSELATNALLHTDGPANIRMRHRAGQLILDVTDTSPLMPDLGTHPDTDTEEPHGYGLALIATTLADTLTVTPHPRCGKTVTATFTIETGY